MTAGTCDCTVHCGDDPWLKDGRARPCDGMLARKEQERVAAEQLAKITELRKTYGAANIYELLDKMQASAAKLKGEAGVMRELLRESLSIVETIEAEDEGEFTRLATVMRQIKGVLDVRAVTL